MAEIGVATAEEVACAHAQPASGSPDPTEDWFDGLQLDPTELPVELLKILASPIRLEILQRLDRSEHDVSLLATQLELDIEHVSYHLRMLRKHDLVCARKVKTRRIYPYGQDTQPDLTATASSGSPLVEAEQSAEPFSASDDVVTMNDGRS